MSHITAPLRRNRDFGLLWLAQFIARTGDVLYEVGVMVTVFERTNSALQTAGVMAAKTLPPFLLGPFAGVLADRFPRKWVMMAMNLLRAALVGSLLLFAVSDTMSIWGVYLVVAGLAIAGTLYNPAHIATIPSLVPRTDLVRANGLVISTDRAAFAAGFGLGGVLILSIGFQALVLLDLSFFVVGALAVALIKLPKRPEEERSVVKRVAIRRDIIEGLSYLGRHTLARPLVSMEILEHVPHGIWTSPLMLVFTKQALGGSAEAWGFQNSAYFGGTFAGAVMATILSNQMARHPGWIIIFNAFISGLLTIAYALSPTVFVAVMVSALFGPTSAWRDVSQDSLLQASVKPDVLGRIYATRTMFANFNFMLAGLGFAWLADYTPIRSIYLVGGLLYLGTAFYALSSAAIRRSRISGAASATP